MIDVSLSNRLSLVFFLINLIMIASEFRYKRK